MANPRRTNRRKVIGYILLAILVLGLAVLAYWIAVEHPGKRYPGIERIRGEDRVPKRDQVLRTSQVAWIGGGSPGFEACLSGCTEPEGRDS